ncbi:hypothetical protein JB92DRAFT_2828384 [Gautieria morchelliformis]|nr:hypothetical protein JB92DRAFT_2828384 [Gautieria morchelliformis]
MLQCLHYSQSALRRRWKHTGSPLEHDLTEWINAKSKTHYALDVFILPTRGRKEAKPLKRIASQASKVGQKLPVGHHLGILPDKYANSLLRLDGSPPWHTPPSPFSRKQWLGGSFVVSEKSPPTMGMNFLMKGIYLDSKRAISEVREDRQVTGTVEVRQRLILSQWYPSKTDLLIEERLTGYYSQPYNYSKIDTTSLVPPKVGILSFAFIPKPSLLQAFANLCEDTHRIHFDRVYAKREGYPGSSADLVVQVPLQLIVILDVMMAYIPDGLSFRAVDYRVINPLFSGRKIKVYRQWIHEVDKDDGSLLTLEDLSARTAPPMFTFQPEEVSKDLEGIPPPAHLRRIGLGRRARLRRMALFWTATDDGTVGTVALITLVPRPGKSFWKLDSEGYLLRRDDSEPHVSSNRESSDTHPDDNDVQDNSTPQDDPDSYYKASEEPFPIFEFRGFDSLGRPITDRTVPGKEPSTDQSQLLAHPWSPQDADDVALERERLERIKKAEALVKSRHLLRRLFDDEDEGYMA